MASVEQSEKRARLSRTDPVELGSRLKSARVAAGLTQGVVALGHLSVGYLSRIESGQRRPDVDMLDAIATRLDLDHDDLLANEESDESTVVEQPVLDFAEIAVGLGDAKTALDHLDTLDTDQLSPSDVMRVELVRAQAFEATGDLNAAIDTLERIEPEVRDAHQRLQVGIVISRCYRELGEYSDAIRSGEGALAGATKLGLEACDESVQLSVTVASAYFERGDRDRAVRICRRAVATAEGLGSTTSRASAYWNASVMSMEQGHVSDAVPMARRALALLNEGSDDRNLTGLLTQVGLMELRLDPPAVDQARGHLSEAQEGMQLSHTPPTQALWARLGLARCALLDGALHEAEDAVASVRDEADGFSPILDADALLLSAQVADAKGDLEGARAHLLNAVHKMTAAGNDRAAAERWMDLAALLESVHEWEAAKDAYRAAAVSSGLQARLVPVSPSHAVLAH